jgi:hypothetical protein
MLGTALLIGGCLGHHSSAAVPTVTRTVLGVDAPTTVAHEMASHCPSSHGKVGLDLHQGTVHLRAQFTCALARHNPSGLAAELVDRVIDRNHAAQRADLTNTLAREVGVRPYPRGDLIWSIGTGASVCYRVDDTAFHRTELAESAHSTDPETSLHWTRVEAVRFAGTCPQRLDAFFDSVARAGQPAAAAEVRKELTHLGVSS